MRRLAVLIALAFAALPARADAVDRLMEALRFSETVGIMRAEGLRHGGALAEEMLGEGGGDRWARVVDGVYDADLMLAQVGAGFAAAMDGVDPGPLLAFFEGPGAEIVRLEIAARRALLDEATQDAAEALHARLVAEGAPLAGQVARMIADSDLVGRNVAGALNANLAFYRGLADGGGTTAREEEMLADVWAQEAEMRQQTEAWLGAFLVLAYQPVAEPLLAEYAALWRSPAGRGLNRALFAAFDAMYADLSCRLGRAVAVEMQGEDL